MDFQADDKKGISIFTGNVKVRMNQDKLNAKKVEVYFETDKKTNNKTTFSSTSSSTFNPIMTQYSFVCIFQGSSFNYKNPKLFNDN